MKFNETVGSPLNTSTKRPPGASLEGYTANATHISLDGSAESVTIVTY